MRRFAPACAGAPHAHVDAMSHETRNERPRAEPEIIPPGATPRGARPRVRVFVGRADATGHAPFKAPGPFTIAAVLLGLGLLVGLVLFLALGALLIALPVLAVVLSAAVAFGVLRRSFRRRGRAGSPVRRF